MPIQIELPGKPVPKGRPRFTVISGHAAPYTPRETRRYEDRLKQAAAIAMIGKSLLAGPVAMRVAVNLEPPASWSRKKRDYACRGLILPCVRPDLDNFGKLALDGCNGIVFKDDGQVADLILTKRYATKASLVVIVEMIADEEFQSDIHVTG